ncbi:MAG TPA: tetratricopeptide repeat protein, partial [Thermoguttaceae bacterium]|nr:tetratricopeptide repeat protein [Thermoguttaceae bacterium]
MFKSSINLAVVAAALISMAAVCRAAEQDLLERAAHGPQQKSGLAAMGDSFSSGVKKGWGALAKPFESLAPKSNSADPTRIETPVDPSADLYAAVARRDEDQGRFREAEEQYRKSLKASSTHLASLLGYGRLLDRQGRHAEAMEQYHRAVKAYPRDARPLNYLSLSLASHGKFDEAVATMEQAIRLEPRQAVYRNNMAVILVEAGKNEAAFRHLCAVHDEATAYYNLGYLLQKRGDTDAALRHFAFALKRNPKFAEARVWIDN